MAAGLTRQMFTALNYLHRRAGVLHRDVKPENFGFAQPLPAGDFAELPTLRLFDFGLSWALPKVVDDESAHEVFLAPLGGTPMYMAPESWERRCGPASDVWDPSSVGLIAYMMLSLDMPYGIAASSCCGDFMEAMREHPLKFPTDRWIDISAEAQMVVAAALERDPRRRLSAAEALASTWLSIPTFRAPAMASRAASEPQLGRESTAWCPPAWMSM